SASKNFPTIIHGKPLSPLNREELDPVITSFMSPIEKAYRPKFKNSLSGQQTVVIYDLDDRGLKRMSNCLTSCDFPFNHIHPVPTVEHLTWALSKYKPTFLFMDFIPYAPGTREQPSLAQLMKMVENYTATSDVPLEHVILTTKVPSDQDTLRQEMIELAHYYHAKIIFKPVNRFSLSEIFGSPSPHPR
ncbi:MAG: hypothetical protein K2X66_04325, partial [Cyanobacteria bacterium]|nr:hypothetical protein [Cyanobacteriota bacterium]